MSKGRVLRMYEDCAVFESLDTGRCLRITRSDRGGRSYETLDRDELPRETSQPTVIPLDAIFGVYELLSGSYLALVVQSVPVIQTKDIEYRKVSKMVVIPLFKQGKTLNEARQRDEDKYLELLHQAFTTHQFYFSFTHDVTHSFQRLAKMTPQQLAQPIWARADRRFFWNRDVCVDLISCAADDWITPIMSAYVEVRPNMVIDDEKFTLLFVSRRSMYRQGTRFTKRGIDEEGNVANFVETEQSLIFADGAVKAYVQVRGSIPVIWCAPVHMKYAPKVYISPDKAKSHDACLKHVEDLVANYSDIHGDGSVLFVNLIDNKKQEGMLGAAFHEAIESTKKHVHRYLRYEWFDFHKECSKMRWHNLSKLINAIDDDFQKQGYFHKLPDGRVVSWQKGVTRSNCVDNLDRTNVVQSLFARRSLVIALGKTDALKSGNVLETPYKDFEKVYKDLWGNNADAMSMLYAGTGALKTDFTRTGKRTTRGALQDGYNSVMRYYLNNLIDGERQDAIDLMLGRYRPDANLPSPFVKRPNQVWPEPRWKKCWKCPLLSLKRVVGVAN